MTDAARARCYRQRHRNGRAIVAVEIEAWGDLSRPFAYRGANADV
jgi:hypothetical protein